jgi:hypothetical protein
VDDLWASFNAEPDPYASTSTATASSSTSAAPASAKPKKIKITVSYDFVGEKVTQVAFLDASFFESVRS